MNKSGQLWLGFALVFFLLVLTAFSTIEPLKETLDNVRGNTGLNCPNTPTFNQTSYDLNSSTEKLTYRPTCFVTGISLVWFIGFILIAGVIWVYNHWRKK